MPKTSEKTLPKPAAVKAPSKGDHVFLVDGSSYIFRAYHALPPLNRKSDGLQVNAVLGFCNMLWKLLRDMPPDNRPTHLAIVFDKSEITFRNKLYPDYKAHRPPAPDDLIPQFPLIREAVRAFDLPCLEQAGFEADDLIATYVRLACARGATATIVSSDKDLMQLVTDCVTMYDTMKDRRIGIAEVIEKFGVPPEKVVEVQALAGDSTDNVPGVPGIGVKTAAKLIAEFGDLETLLARVAEVKQNKCRESLISFADQARHSARLVKLDDAEPLNEGIADFAVHDPDPAKLMPFLQSLELGNLLRRAAPKLGVALDEVPAVPPAPVVSPPQMDLRPKPAPADKVGPGAVMDPARLLRPIDYASYETIADVAALNRWIAAAQEAGLTGISVETDDADPMRARILGIALAVGVGIAGYIPLAHRADGGLDLAGSAALQLSEREALARLGPLFEDG